MGLKEQISDDIKTAMKARDPKLLSVLRMMLSEIKYLQAQTNLHTEIDDQTVIKVISTYQKRLVKSIDEYPEGEKRDEIKAEVAIVERYLPKKASADDINKAIDEVLAASPDRNFGPLMKQVMGKLGASADGKAVGDLIKSRLS